MPLSTVPLGSNGLIVPVLGFGAMGCTAFYNADPAATESASLEAIATVRRTETSFREREI
jgi:aryl-alcohol dehydrogenase-like predicted oxidoreductase